jgi:hypothetical protein
MSAYHPSEAPVLVNKRIIKRDRSEEALDFRKAK